jgi:hypothetical protein
MMKKTILIFLLIGLTFCFSAASLAAEDPEDEQDKVLSSAEFLFKAMKEKNYPAIWSSLTASSKKDIVDTVYKAAAKSETEYSREQISIDFGIGGLIAKTYWASYLTAFDPDTVLEQSRWNIGFIKKEKAEINIQYKKAEKPAILKMYKEEGTWKVGLEETFEGRKFLSSW